LKGEHSQMRAQFDRRRQYVAGRLAKMSGVHLDSIPEGAFYIFPRVSDLYGKPGAGEEIDDSVRFAERLLETARVAVVPGLPFGSDRHIRIFVRLLARDAHRRSGPPGSLRAIEGGGR
jgi:aspartate aminotransferase